MEEENIGRLTKIVKIGGYMVGAGALVGFSVGIYMLFDRALFSYFIQVAQFEVLSFFLSVFMPSFIMLIVIAYLLVATFGMKQINLTSMTSLCVLSALSMVLSALSIFYFISFLGGLLTLAVSIRAYAKPSFNSSSSGLAFFLVEFGAMFVGSSSILFLLMWGVSNFFGTYAMGFLGSYSPIALLLVVALSFVAFFVVPFWVGPGTKPGSSATLGLLILFLSYLFAIQSRYILFNASAYIGMSLLVAGFALALIGNMMYLRLFFSVHEPTVVPTMTLLQGRYCPYCGNARVASSQDSCLKCGRSLMWSPNAPFCSSCGKLVPTNTQVCTHCQEDIGSKMMYYNLTEAKEHLIADRSLTEYGLKRPPVHSGLMKWLLRMRLMLKPFERMLLGAKKVFFVVIERLDLTLKETVFVFILTYVFGFLSFIGYVRVEPSTLEIIPGRMTNFLVSKYGFPLAWFLVRHSFSTISLRVRGIYDVTILWPSLALDFMMYLLMSLALVYGVKRFRH